MNQALRLVVLTTALLSGCLHLSPSEQALYNEWQEDSEAPDYEGPYDPSTAGLLSLLPGGGYFYLGQVGNAIWFGVPLWPTGLPAIGAVHDAKVLNKRAIAKQYASWLKRRRRGGGSQQQQQQIGHQGHQGNVVVITGEGKVKTQGTTPPSDKSSATRVDELERLAKLRREGVLTEREFEAEKRRVLHGK